MNAQSETNTRLRGKWLLVARLAWGILFLTLTAMYAFGFLAVRDALSTVCEEEPCTLYMQIRHTAAVEVAVYHITQEALTNLIRHTEAHTCHVRLSLDVSAGLLCLEVQDDGKGLQMKRRAGVGLNSMRERAEELGGSCLIRSSPDSGTHVQARLPVGEFNRSVASLDR